MSDVSKKSTMTLDGKSNAKPEGSRQTGEMMYVTGQSSGRQFFVQSLGEWFLLGLMRQTCLEAAFALPQLAALTVRATVSTDLSAQPGEPTEPGASAAIRSWTVRLDSMEGRALFTKTWPVNVLEQTALAVADQLKAMTGESRVLYGALHYAILPEQSKTGEIDFDSDARTATCRIPHVPICNSLADYNALYQSSGEPEVYLLTERDWWAEIEAAIEDSPEVELAWAAPVTIMKAPGSGAVVYRLQRPEPLRSTAATATLCPISPEELFAVAGLGHDPLAFLHSHPPRTATCQCNSCSDYAGVSLLQPSWEDFRCLYTLPAGSIGLILTHSKPLRMSAYAWLPKRLTASSCRMAVLELPAHCQSSFGRSQYARG